MASSFLGLAAQILLGWRFRSAIFGSGEVLAVEWVIASDWSEIRVVVWVCTMVLPTIWCCEKAAVVWSLLVMDGFLVWIDVEEWFEVGKNGLEVVWTMEEGLRVFADDWI